MMGSVVEEGANCALYTFMDFLLKTLFYLYIIAERRGVVKLVAVAVMSATIIASAHSSPMGGTVFVM